MVLQMLIGSLSHHTCKKGSSIAYIKNVSNGKIYVKLDKQTAVSTVTKTVQHHGVLKL